MGSSGFGITRANDCCLWEFAQSADALNVLQGGAQQSQVPQEDFEREISGGRVVPKPLPLVTPSPAVSPAPGVMRQQHAARKDIFAYLIS